MRIVVVGAGPTGMGAACRLAERGHDDWDVYEATDHVGGLASSVTDDKGFIWDHGGHVTFSHYPYVDELVSQALGDDYCGVNDSGEAIEVVRVVDDRFGILEVPEGSTLVAPGEELCITDVGVPVEYEPVESDAGTTLVNNAVVTVRTVGDGPGVPSDRCGRGRGSRVRSAGSGGTHDHGVTGDRIGRHRCERASNPTDRRCSRLVQRWFAACPRTATQGQLTFNLGGRTPGIPVQRPPRSNPPVIVLSNPCDALTVVRSGSPDPTSSLRPVSSGLRANA